MWLRSAYPQGVEGGSVSIGPYLAVVKSGPRGGRLSAQGVPSGLCPHLGAGSGMVLLGQACWRPEGRRGFDLHTSGL